MAECCNNFGGQITVDVDGKKFGVRGDIVLEPTNLEVEGDANHDGSPYYVSKPRLYRANFKVSQPCDWIWDLAVRKCKINVTIDEIDNDRLHMFTDAHIVGKVSQNLSNGEVDGFNIAGARYQRV